MTLWYPKDHTLHAKLNRDTLELAFVCAINESGRSPSNDDPCRVDYDLTYDGEPSLPPLHYCNFLQWADEYMAEELLDPDVRDFEVMSMPLTVAFRWDGDGYLWAPRSWVEARGGVA